jgi:hypothetical protein
MNFNHLSISLNVIALLFCCLTLTGRCQSADDKADAKDRIKDLQKQRLKAVTTARDYLVKQLKADDLAESVNSNGFIQQLLDSNKTVFHARLDLCDSKAERTKAIEETIKETEPILEIFTKHLKKGIVDSPVPYHLFHAQVLELKNALEKARQEPGEP